MPYVISENRYQVRKTTLDSLVSANSEARIIDAFVDALDLEKLGVKKAVPAKEGMPAYNPRDLLKLYI